MKCNDAPRRESFIYVIRRMIGITFRTSPVGFFLYLVASLGFTALLIADLHLIRVLLDDLPLFVNGEVAFRAVLLTVLLLGGVNLIDTLMNATLNALYEYMQKRVTGSMTVSMADKSANLGLIRFESAELYNDVERASTGSGRGFESMEAVVFSAIFHGGYFLFLAMYLATIKPLIILGIFASFLPIALSRYLRASAVFRTEHLIAPMRREFRHFEACMTDRSFFKETRTTRSVGYFMQRCRTSLAGYIDIMWRTEFRAGVVGLLLKILTLAGYAGLLVILVRYVLKADISPGMFGAMYFAMDSFFKWFEELFDRLGSAYEQAGFGGNYLKFLALTERPDGVPIPQNRDVIIENVSFRYPGAARNAVDNVTTKLKPGESVAIVGENGAGKSTFVRLITGQYHPDSGRVTTGGIDVAAGSGKYEHVSAVYQTFQCYRISLGENVSISDSSRGESHRAEERRVEDSLKQVGMAVVPDRFPDGVDTVLSREFGGTDLSMGEWQRVAIARGLYRQYDTIILDEPTASIDPIQESRLYRIFLKAATGKTAIIVTHRLGSARIADRILVMDKGNIVEDGSHEYLMSTDGLYARMFRAQSQWYKREQQDGSRPLQSDTSNREASRSV